MFTGIIEGIGTILHVETLHKDKRFTIEAPFNLSDNRVGDSISINGACLTFESISGSHFTCYASTETLECTNLSLLRISHSVNLERTLKVGNRLDGHWVLGHVDGMARLINKRKEGESLRLRFTLPKEFMGQVVQKGSIAVDGISLTINACGDDFFEVNIIPSTQKITTLSNVSVGSYVNIETDILGKYIERNLRQNGLLFGDKSSKIDLSFLQSHGF